MSRFLRIIAAGASVGAVAVAATSPVQAKPAPPAHLVSVVTRDDVRLTVSVPETSAPRGSLVLVTFKIGNLTGAPLQFAPSCIFGYSRPAAKSLGRSKRYPPAFPPLFKVPRCTMKHRYDASAIPAGYEATIYRYLALRGRLVGFTMTEAVIRGKHLFPGLGIPSDPISLRLTGRTSHPVIHFGREGARVVASVSNVLSGDKLHLQAQAICRHGKVSRQTRWFLGHGDMVAAPCAHPLRWRVAAGTVGRTVGVGTYVSTAA